MLKMIVDDYRRGFRSAWKAGIYAPEWTIFFYVMAVVPGMSRLNLWQYMAGAVPVTLGIFLSRTYPDQMGKLMYLCPLSGEERKKYLKTAYWLRVSIPMAVSLVYNTVAAVQGWFSFFYSAGLSIFLFFYLLGVNVYGIPFRYQREYAGKAEPYAAVWFESWCLFHLMIGMIGALCFGTIDMLQDKMKDRIFLVVFIVAEMLLSFKLLVSYYMPILTWGMHYENSHPFYRKKGEKNGWGKGAGK